MILTEISKTAARARILRDGWEVIAASNENYFYLQNLDKELSRIAKAEINEALTKMYIEFRNGAWVELGLIKRCFNCLFKNICLMEADTACEDFRERSD